MRCRKIFCKFNGVQGLLLPTAVIVPLFTTHAAWKATEKSAVCVCVKKRDWNCLSICTAVLEAWILRRQCKAYYSEDYQLIIYTLLMSNSDNNCLSMCISQKAIKFRKYDSAFLKKILFLFGKCISIHSFNLHPLHWQIWKFPEMRNLRKYSHLSVQRM